LFDRLNCQQSLDVVHCSSLRVTSLRDER